MAHVRQSRPDAGLDSQVKILEMFQVVPCSLGGVDEVLIPVISSSSLLLSSLELSDTRVYEP